MEWILIFRKRHQTKEPVPELLEDGGSCGRGRESGSICCYHEKSHDLYAGCGTSYGCGDEIP